MSKIDNLVNHYPIKCVLGNKKNYIIVCPKWLNNISKTRRMIIFLKPRWHQSFCKRICHHRVYINVFNRHFSELDFVSNYMILQLNMFWHTRALVVFREENSHKLSQFILIGLEIEFTILRLEIKFRNQIACDIAWWCAISLTSIMEEAVMVCLMLFHDIAPTTSEKIYPNVDFRESNTP